MKKIYTKNSRGLLIGLLFCSLVNAQAPTTCTDLPALVGPCSSIVQNFNSGPGGFTSTASSGSGFVHNAGADGDMRVLSSISNTTYTLRSPGYLLTTDNVAFIGFTIDAPRSGIVAGSTMRVSVLNSTGTEIAFCVINAFREAVCVRFNDADLDPGTTVNYQLTLTTVADPGRNGAAIVIDDFSIGSAGAALPVTLESFQARRNNTTVSLNWETVSESNFNGFFIQRKSGNSPFENIGFVASRSLNGSSNARLRYSFNDMNNNNSGAIEYRIIEADRDGRARFSVIRSVDGLKGKAKILIYPNPSANKPINIVFPNSDTRTILLTDLMGRIHSSWKSYTSQDLKLTKLAPGGYILRVTNVVTSQNEVHRITISE